MSISYSKSTGGFYDARVHGDSIPRDAVEITSEQHAALLDGQSQGQRIASDGSGFPLLLAAPVPTTEELKESAQAGIDAHFEQLYCQVVPNSAIAAEYNAAYASAKEWLLDPKRDAPERVKALAEGYDLTNLQAAQLVVDKWTEAQSLAFDLRGAARLRAKTAIRSAKEAEGVDAAFVAGRLAMEQVKFLL